MSRELLSGCGSPVETPIHIYFKRLQVDVHNVNILASLPGSMLTFESTDTGQAKSLDKKVNAVLHLKPGCKVMLLYNITQHLRNGTCGQFVDVDSDSGGLLVNFPKVGVATVHRRVWYQYDETGKVQATRIQFPLTLSYAITTHKSQGLTMNRIVVHCSPEFLPGQTYVAISRVKREDDVRVVGFRKYFLMPPPASLNELILSTSVEPELSFRCCRKMEISEACSFTDKNHECIDADNSADNGERNDCSEYEAVVKEYFESSECASVNLEDVLLCLSDFTHELSHPPIDFNITTFIEMIRKPNGNDFCDSINSAATFAEENLEMFDLLACVLWCRIATIFSDYLTDNLKDTHLTNKNFTNATSKLHELFITNEYRSDIISVFNVEKWSDVNTGQKSFAAQLLFHLYELFMVEVGKRVRKQEEQNPVCFRVDEMDLEGKGKIRYIGGWAVRKCLEKSRRYVEGNVRSNSNAVCEKVSKEMKKVCLLENNIITPYCSLAKETSSPETLNVTECRQFRERGLLHITDSAYEFFLKLEQERVNNINLGKLISHQANIVDNSIDVVSNSEILRNQFRNLFNLDENEDQEIIVYYSNFQR